MNGVLLLQEQSTPRLQQGTDKKNRVWINEEEIAPVARIEAIRLKLHCIFHRASCHSDGCQECILIWQHHRKEVGLHQPQEACHSKVSPYMPVKRIFKVPSNINQKLGLWYPKDSPFIRKLLGTVTMLWTIIDENDQLQDEWSYPGRRLVTWQCKKQTIVAYLPTEAEE
ncbi:hypothetical protein Tco_1336540 [Tanacetum coccineum]